MLIIIGANTSMRRIGSACCITTLVLRRRPSAASFLRSAPKGTEEKRSAPSHRRTLPPCLVTSPSLPPSLWVCQRLESVFLPPVLSAVPTSRVRIHVSFIQPPFFSSKSSEFWTKTICCPHEHKKCFCPNLL